MKVATNLSKEILPVIATTVLLSFGNLGGVAEGADNVVATAESKECVECHQEQHSGIIGQWKQSAHARAKVGCYECHQAKKGEKDAFEHQGVFIATIVSPKDCSRCHEKQYTEFEASHHADAGRILGSQDNVLAEVVEGFTRINPKGEKVVASAAAVSGCLQCHGAEIKVLPDGKLDPTTWPNTGMGRLNPDGSKGSCSACHLRHDFSRAQARQPENCGRCHLGPDHPQLEVYNESAHGIAFAANRQRFVTLMGQKDWLPGVHYEQGPTCSTCHMGATRELPMTHDVGGRISWTLRPPVSEKIDAAAKKEGKNVKSSENRRTDMKKVCLSCHGSQWVDNWYSQFDNLVGLYNEKFGKPATELYKMIQAKKLVSSDVLFDDKIEFTYYLLWHHEGRRARHGAAMMGPDYTQWHGMFEVAERFYHQFIPELKDVIQVNKKKGGSRARAAGEVEAKMNQVLNQDMHKWFLGKMSLSEKKAREKAAAEFKKRYAQ